MVFSAHYYNAVQQPNVDVAVGAIDRVEANGVRMQDGSFHELDVIVLATGFKVDQFIRPTIVEGRIMAKVLMHFGRVALGPIMQ